MYRWLAILLLGTFLLPVAPVAAQEFYESPYVILLQATKCVHSPTASSGTTNTQTSSEQKTRFQTGFRVKGKPGIFTALHGIADCDSVYIPSGDYTALIIFEVDIDRDVARLCIAKELRTNPQTQQPECLSNSSEDGFTPASTMNAPLPQLKIVGHPAGSPGQYTIESIKAAKTSTDTLASLVGPTMAIKLEKRQSPLPTIRVIPLEGALAAGLSGAPVLTADDQLIGMGDGSQAEGLSWLIPWSELQMISIQVAQAQLDQLRNLDPDDFFLNASTDEQAVNTDYVVYSGRVFDEQDNLVERARVILDLDHESHIVYTDSEGKFEITVAAKQSSRGRIYIQAENYSPLNRLIDLLAAERQVEQYALRSVASDILYCRFAFRIIDTDLNPIRGAHVKVLYGLEFIEDFTNSDGEYRSELPCDKPNPLVSVEVTAESFASVEKLVKLYPSLIRIQLLHSLAATATPSSTPTFTPSPTPTPQPTATITPTPTRGYPCLAEIKSDFGLSKVDRVYRDPSSSSLKKPALAVGRTVEIRKKFQGKEILYNIWSVEGAKLELGWIASADLNPSLACPPEDFR